MGKILVRRMILINLMILFTACQSPVSTPETIVGADMQVTEPVQVMETSLAMTSPAPTITPSPAPPGSSIFDQIPATAEELDHAMSTAQAVYDQYPFIHEIKPNYSLYGEYLGCAGSNSFQNFVDYPVALPLKDVYFDFISYFGRAGWDEMEAIPNSPYFLNEEVPTTTYREYRILPGDPVVYERLVVTLVDESAGRGGPYTSIRVILTHIETGEDLAFLLSAFPNWHCSGPSWLWMKLYK